MTGRMTPSQRAAVKARVGGGAFTMMKDAVVKVYAGRGRGGGGGGGRGGGGGWAYTGIWGAATILINRALKTTVVRVYDLDDGAYTLRFEYEFHRGTDVYHDAEERFHYFETSEMVVGFSFADAEAARIFANSAKKFIKLYCKPMSNASSASVPIASRRNVPQRKEKKSGFLGRLFGRGSVAASDSGGGAAAANFEIGAISNVEHKSHVGLDSEGNMQMPDGWMQGTNGLKATLRAAGVSKKQYKEAMKDPVLKAEVRTPTPEAPTPCARTHTRALADDDYSKKLDLNGVMILYTVLTQSHV